MHEIIMPKLGLSMEKGTIIQWFKKPGDKVEKGEALLEVEADKANLEVEAYHTGYLLSITKGEGEVLPVNTIIGYIGEKGEAVPDTPAAEAASRPEEQPLNPEPKIETTVEEKAKALEGKIADTLEGDRLKVTPLARKMAAEYGLNLRENPVPGTGHNGKIRKKDILAWKTAPRQTSFSTAASAGPIIRSATKLAGMRKAIAERMSFSKSHIPHFVLTTTVEVSELIKLRNQINPALQNAHGQKISFTDFILKICGLALVNNRSLNAALVEEEHRIYESINIGMAVALEEGLVVPTINRCDTLSLVEISRERTRLSEKARNTGLEVHDMQGATFTVSNLGMHSIRSFNAIINPPQAAILAVGEIFESAVVKNGTLQPGHCLNLSLSVDHRIVDGAVAARFMDQLKELFENPNLLAAL